MPQRSCMGCNLKKDKKDLIRIVKDQAGNISIDKTGKAPGRGAYLCDSIECFEKAKKTKKLERALDTQIGEEIYETLRSMIGGK